MSTTHSGNGSSSGVQRRKTTRSKSKQKQQQTQQRNVAENIVENQNESNEQNERLHFRSRSATSAAAESPALASVGYNSPSPLCCNGLLSTTAASLICCRDVNCHLNAPLALPLRGSVERSRRSESRQSFLTDTSKPTSTTTPTPTPTTSSASLTSASKKSRSRSRSCSCDAAACDDGKGKQSASSGVCDSSSDRGSGTAEQFTVSLHIDLFSWGLFLLAFLTRFYRLATPKHVV